jgi:predicted membrane protein
MRSTYLLDAAPLVQILLSNILSVLILIEAVFIKAYGKVKVIVVTLATRLPIMMADDDENYKDKFKYIIIAIVVLVVGAVTVSIVSGVGLYILNVFNNTAVKIPANYNYVSPIAPTLGSIFQILVVVLIIIALIFVIRYLMRSTDMF